MASQKIDRRVKYSRQVLKSTLIKLMKDIPLSKISITMLCEEADVNRGTFYNNYIDQYDLYQQIEEELINQFKEHINEHIFEEHCKTSLEWFESMLEYVVQNKDILIILLSKGYDSNFRKELIEIVQKISQNQLTNPHINQKLFSNQKKREYLDVFLIDGCFSMLYKWLNEGMNEPISEMAELIDEILNR